MLSGQDQVGRIFVGLQLDDLGNVFARLELQQVGDVLPACGPGRLGQLVGLQAIHAPEVGEEQNPVVRRGHKEVPDDVVLLELSPADALPATLLVAVEIHLGALGIPCRRNGGDDVLPRDEVLFGDIVGSSDDLRAAVVTVVVDDLLELVAHNLPLALRPGQDVLEVGDGEFEFLQLVDNLLPLQGRELAQPHPQNGVGLELVDIEEVHQPGSRDLRGLRRANQRDDLVEHIQRFDQASQDMGALFGLIQAVLGASDDDVDLVIDVQPQ